MILHLEELKKELVKYPVKEYDTNIHGKEDYDFKADGEPYLIEQLVIEEGLVGAVDMGHGHDLLWDGTKWHIAKYGIFLKRLVFLTDYYGYPEGALFRRII